MKNYLESRYDINSDSLAEVFDELPFWAAPFGIRLLERVVLHGHMTALDLGFGAGFPLIELAMRLGSGGKVYGIDPWKAAERRARKKMAVYGIDNVEIIDGLAESIPLESGSVDLITSNNCLNNVADLKKALGECYRVLKPGGQFLQTMNLDGTMLEFYRTMESVLTDFDLKPLVGKMHEQIRAKRKPLEETIRGVEEAGFRTVEVFQDSFDYRFVDGSAMLNHSFIKLAFLEGWRSIVPKDREESVFDEAERRMNREAAEKGEFKLSVPFAVIDSRRKNS